MLAVDLDTVGRIAIRLGRAYDQRWCSELDRTEWCWDTAVSAIKSSRTKNGPTCDADGIYLDARGMDWTFTQDHCGVDFFDKDAGLVAKVSLVDSNVAGPHIAVYLHDFAQLAVMQNQCWRVDRAISSMAVDQWKPLYSLPPLEVIAKVFAGHLPGFPTHLYYVDGPAEPTIRVACQWRTEDECLEAQAFSRRMELFEKKGGMKEWHKIRVAS